MQVDHINHNTLDNRRENLRLCTHTQNNQNAKKKGYSKNKYKGITKQDNKWIARIRYKGKNLYLGRFKTEEEAHIAYCEAGRKYQREYFYAG